MGIGLQDQSGAADPTRVTIASTRNNQAIGLVDTRNRISELQRRMGMAATWAVPAQGPTTGAPAAKTAGDNAFLQALQQATGSSNGSTDLSTLLAGAGVGSSSTSASALGSGPSSSTDVLMEALGTTPVYATMPDGLPPVAITDTMRAAGNGNLPDSLLASINQGSHRLAKPAADAFLRMTAAARKDGVTFGVNDAYRTYAEQVDLAGRLGLYGEGGLAAVPGTSNHGWGQAVDLQLDDSAQSWMTENGWRYGFFEDVPGESWHWTYRAS